MAVHRAIKMAGDRFTRPFVPLPDAGEAGVACPCCGLNRPTAEDTRTCCLPGGWDPEGGQWSKNLADRDPALAEVGIIMTRLLFRPRRVAEVLGLKDNTFDGTAQWVRKKMINESGLTRDEIHNKIKQVEKLYE